MADRMEPVLTFALDMDFAAAPDPDLSVVLGETGNIARIAREAGGDVIYCPTARTSIFPLPDAGQIAELITIAAAPPVAASILKQSIKSIGHVMDTRAARRITVKYRDFEITASSIEELEAAVEVLKPLLMAAADAAPDAAPRKKKKRKKKA